MGYLLNISALLSQAVNVIILFGHPDQTVSARAYEMQDRPLWGYIYRSINAVFFWQDDHCMVSYLQDVSRARRLLEFRSNG